MDKSPRQPTESNQKSPNTNEHPFKAANGGLTSSSNQSTPFPSSVGSSHHTLGQIADQFQDRSSEKLNISNFSNGNNNRESTDVNHHDDEDGEGGDDEQNLMDYDDDPEGDALIAHGNESTGRWTRNEHDLFLDALKKYGKVIMFFMFYMLLMIDDDDDNDDDDDDDDDDGDNAIELTAFLTS